MPDITGFTEFVNNTEIEHGQHIISELLEIIIKSDNLKLTVNEIEGDAVLFYKLEDIPTYDQLVKQAIKIFTEFHKHLKKYEHDRICDCGACSGASSLSLKIIAHAGVLGFTTIHKQKKLYGKDLIIIHKLLKNEVNLPEYFLFSNDLIKQLPSNQDNIDQLQKGSAEYDKIGKVAYEYLSLTPYLEQIDYTPPASYLGKVKNPLKHAVNINKPIAEVYELLTNLKYRTSWNDTLDDLLHNPDMVNREGTIHQCVVNDKLIDLETVRNDLNEEEKGFGERLLSLPPGMKTVVFYYILRPNEDGSTKLTHETHLTPTPIIGWVMKFVFARFFLKGAVTALTAFKKFCESDKAIV
jgi:hypothetical protein